MTTRPAPQRGGFLLEAALVLLVAGLLTVSTFEIQATLRKRQQVSDARHLVQAADAAVRAFVLREGRLPCPDIAGSGVEATAAGPAACARRAGSVPFVSLGMELPNLPNGLVLRYGVAGDLLGQVADGPALLGRALAASRAAPGLGQVWVGGRGDDGAFSDCGRAAFNPAYVLMWAPVPGANEPQALLSLCFSESRDGVRGLVAMERLEFLGWLRSALGA